MVTSPQNLTILEAAKVMRDSQVDELIVIDRMNGRSHILGRVSAWNIVAMVLATELDHTALTLGDIVTPPEYPRCVPCILKCRSD